MWKPKIFCSFSAAAFISLASISFQLFTPAQASESSFLPSAESFVIESSARVNTRKPKVALVLGGGGLRGAAHVGILRALEREGVPIDLVVGTSMGAIVGGLYCAGVNTDQLEKELVPCFISSYYTAPLSVQVIKMNVSCLLLRRPQGLYDGKTLARFIDTYVPKGRREISTLSPRFAAVAADLLEGQTRTLTDGDLGKALQASSAIPLLRDPVALDGALLVDGGTICNLPVDQARLLGADFIIAVDVNEKIQAISKKNLDHRIVKSSSRVLSMMLAKIDEGQKANADICIQPDVTGISLFSKKKADGARALSAGESAARKAMPELKVKLMLAGIKLRSKENVVSLKPD